MNHQRVLGDGLNDSKPWGDVIGASLVIQMATFSGLVLVGFVGCFQKLNAANPAKKHSFWLSFNNLVIPSFASGALLATAVFLLLPEGFELLSGAHAEAHDEHRRSRFLNSNETVSEDHEDHEDHEDEKHNQAAWMLGASLLGGFLFPILLGAIFPSPECVLATETNLSPAAQAKVCVDEENSEVDVDGDTSRNSPTKELSTTADLNCVPGEFKHHDGKTTDVVAASSRHLHNAPLVAIIVVGDFCHNFCDGIFVGTAFLLCDKSIAWAITATTVYHEIAQEIGDFGLLTYQCGLTVPQALVVNFLSGASVMIGGLLVLAINLSDRAIGSILCISAGVYLYIATSECIPRILVARRRVSDTLVFLGCFILGAVPIGLVLLNHGHCEPDH